MEDESRHVDEDAEAEDVEGEARRFEAGRAAAEEEHGVRQPGQDREQADYAGGLRGEAGGVKGVGPGAGVDEQETEQVCGEARGGGTGAEEDAAHHRRGAGVRVKGVAEQVHDEAV